MENAQIADIFDEIADLLALKEGNEYRIRSYRNAARTVRDLSERLEDMVEADDDLTELPNIGESTAEKIHEIIETGTCERLENLREEVPEALTELMDIPNLGARKAMKLHEALGVETVDDLKEACENEKVREIEGFGETSEAKLLEAIERHAGTATGRFLYKAAADHVTSIGRVLDRIDTVKQWEVAGSFRRAKETVGDLDILVQADDRSAATDAVVEGLEDLQEVMSRGSERVTVRLESGMQVDFRFFDPPAFGSALLYFTGSKDHSIKLRQKAVKRDWKLNEYGLFSGDNRLAGRDEASVYHRLDLPWIPPELREDRGEVEAADEDRLPRLLEPGDVRGDLQAHTEVTDGNDSIREIARAAADRGLEYFAVTDHTKHVSMAKGLDEDALAKHLANIREVDADFDDMWLIAGVEVDILKSGKLDLDEDALAEADWVVASIHYNRDMPSAKMTDRIVSAVRSGVVHCLGHPLGRVIEKREPLDFDVEKVFEACAEAGVYVEINAQPDRLDLPDTYIRTAKDAGCRFTIGTDAHKQADLDFLRFGVNVARRGWLQKGDLLNTRTARQLRKELGKD